MPNQNLIDLDSEAFPGSDTLYYGVKDPGGTPADVKITQAQLAAAVGESEKWLHPQDFTAMAGSPVIAENPADAAIVWLFDAAATEFIATPLKVPSWWQTYAVDFYWHNAGAGAGDVAWFVSGYRMQLGQVLNASSPHIATTTNVVTAEAQSVFTMHTIATGLVVPASTHRTQLLVGRVGGNAGDTLANDAALDGVELRRLT